MFDRLPAKTAQKACNTIDTLIGVKTEFKGDISFSGGLRIDGKVKGDITAKGEANSALVLSEHAVVTGNVTVPHMIVNGTIKGDVHCSEHISLQPKAEIVGDLTYKIIEIAAGASISGNLIREGEKQGVVTRLRSAEPAARKDGE